mmetsp:Transcript_17575/g.29452  ORF Transcript_17575/g.29452 Transcript_17575/m.29452 type:complete len:155 (-) Transcript_17575:189-653(-)
MFNSVKRLRKELSLAQKTPDGQIRLALENEENIRKWRGFITGPPDSPFEGFEFELAIDIPGDYPLVPPGITCVTKCFHPNIHWVTGEICLDILKKEWSPAWSIQSACRAIISLLQEPAPDSPLNCDAGNMLRAEDHRAFRSLVRMYCEEYATKV